jgi:hypothetical protein
LDIIRRDLVFGMEFKSIMLHSGFKEEIEGVFEVGYVGTHEDVF